MPLISMGENTRSRAIRIEVPPKASNPNEQIIFDGDWLPASFRNQSYQISRDCVRYVCRQGEPDPPRGRACKIMRLLVDDTLQNRLDMMRTLVTKLDIREREHLQLLQDVATDMFDDQVVSWGRIVTLHAFCGYLARYCEERYLPDCADDVGHILGNIVVNRLGLWIVANGGWTAFEGQFPSYPLFEADGFWKCLGIVALLVGAVLAFYTSVRFISGSGGSGVS